MLLPVIGAGVLMVLPAGKPRHVRMVAMSFVLATFALSLLAAYQFNWNQTGEYEKMPQLTKDVEWISSIGSHYYVGVDGISMPLLLLTTGISVLACFASFAIEKQVR